jgi:hypothetical protein
MYRPATAMQEFWKSKKWRRITNAVIRAISAEIRKIRGFNNGYMPPDREAGPAHRPASVR